MKTSPLPLLALVLWPCLAPLHAAGPDLQVSHEGADPSRLSFGTVPHGGCSGAKSITLTNQGDATLELLPVERTGFHAEDFTITQPPTTSLPPGQSTSFTIHFHPNVPELRFAQIRIPSNDPAPSPYLIDVDGVGNIPGGPSYLVQTGDTTAGTSTDEFGHSVAISGDTYVIGAPYADTASGADSGVVYVYVRTANNNSWEQQAILAPSATYASAGDLFGWSVSISGDTMLVGAQSEDSSVAGVNGTPNSGSSASGAAYVFTRQGGVWTQQAFLKASNPGVGDEFGVSVAISGDTAVVGAFRENSSVPGVNGIPDENSNDAGAAYVFARAGGAWTQQAFLKASNPGTGDNFGWSVAVSGDRAMVGAYKEDGGGSGVNPVANEAAQDSGAAYIFRRDAGNWIQEAYLKASNPGAGDQFGYSTSLSDDTAVAGALLEDGSGMGVDPAPNESAIDSGAAYAFSGSSGDLVGRIVVAAPGGVV